MTSCIAVSSFADSCNYNEHSLELWRLKRMQTRRHAERTAHLAVNFFDRIRDRISSRMRRQPQLDEIGSPLKFIAEYFLPGGKDTACLSDRRSFASDLKFRESSNPAWISCDLMSEPQPESDEQILGILAAPSGQADLDAVAGGIKLLGADNDPLARQALRIVNRIALMCGTGL
jgi:hypothetical protein